MTNRICSIPECERIHFARGWCNRHYKKWRKYGDPLHTLVRNQDRPCSVVDCPDACWSSGYCVRHYTRYHRYGDALIRLPGESLNGCYICVGCNQDIPASDFYRPGKESCRSCIIRRQSTRSAFGRMDFPYECVGCGSPFFGTKSKCRFCSDDCRQMNSDYNSRRKARLLQSPTENIDRLQVFIRDGWQCGLCAKPITKSLKWPDPLSASLDHIIPLARHGSHTMDNAQAAHLICNMSKGARQPVAV